MTRPALIGDIGGTHARFALGTPGALEGIAPRCRTPAEVTAAGSGGDGARATLLRFLTILGDVSGDAALTRGPAGASRHPVRWHPAPAPRVAAPEPLPRCLRRRGPGPSRVRMTTKEVA